MKEQKLHGLRKGKKTCKKRERTDTVTEENGKGTTEKRWEKLT